MEEYIEKTWVSILQQYTPKIKQDSREKSPGMALFLMFKSEETSPFNCKYIFLKRGEPMYNRYLDYSNMKDKITEKYDPDKMYLVSVQIPDPGELTRTVGNIRAFLYDNDTEVKIT